jgi:hypothetical protein
LPILSSSPPESFKLQRRAPIRMTLRLFILPPNRPYHDKLGDWEV